MTKFSGTVGWVISQETAEGSGVWENVPTERTYYGDVLREARQWSKSEQLNDDLSLSNRISIVADDFAFDNFSTMRYVKFGGGLWKVTNIEIQRPRLILTLGGVYNGQSA